MQLEAIFNADTANMSMAFYIPLQRTEPPMNEPITFEEWFNSLTKPGKVLDSYSTMLPNTKLTMKATLAAGWHARDPEIAALKTLNQRHCEALGEDSNTIRELHAKIGQMEEALKVCKPLVEAIGYIGSDSRENLELQDKALELLAALNGGKVDKI